MEPLNQFFISRTLGSTMKHMKKASLGPMAARHVQNQVLAQRPHSGEQITFAPPVEKTIIRAFEDVRQGLPVDRVFADPNLAASFFKRCRQLEVNAPQSALALRILRLRKSARIHRATAPREPRRDFTPYLYAAEMASSQIRYRFGASVDDILAYPEIGKEFDKLAAQIQPGWTPLDYRLAALHVRKSRYCKPEERSLFETIKTLRVEDVAKEVGALDTLGTPVKFDKPDGIIGLVERTPHASRFLYLSQAKDMPDVIPFTKKGMFDALANTFWSPSLSSIYLIIYGIHEKFRNASQAVWTKKLIHEKAPIFNWRIRFKATAA
jgi:hypothetical protein